MLLRIFSALFLAHLIGAHSAYAETPKLEISLAEAEQKTLKNSPLLKSSVSEAEAAEFQKKSQFTSLFPKLSLEGTYQYVTSVPEIAIAGFPPIRLGTNSMYSVGPVLRYTLWDASARRKSFESSSKLAEARTEDRKNAALQLLFNLRLSYVQVQLAMEELRLVNRTLVLARAQDKDIAIRFKSGAASRLDRVTSERSVLNYQLQFQQKQAELSLALTDLLAFMGDAEIRRFEGNLSQPGPPDIGPVSLVVQLDSLTDTIAREAHTKVLPPDEGQPRLRSLNLQAESADLAASSQTAKLFPALQLSAKTSLDYPNGPVAEQIHQNTFSVGVALPFYLGDPTWHLASERRSEAEATRYRKEQLQIDIDRDFMKTQEQLRSLKEQREFAARDVEMSEEVAKLYYSSYKVGKGNILDVQTANNLAFQARVTAARLDAQILSQLDALKALSGKEVQND